jgi:hypothetical protein
LPEYSLKSRRHLSWLILPLLAVLIIGFVAIILLKPSVTHIRRPGIYTTDSCTTSVAPGLIARSAHAQIHLPSQISVPSSTAIYGVTISGTGNSDQLYDILAFAHGHCYFSMGADGASGIGVTQRPYRQISQIFSPGGAAITDAFACAYIPQVMRAIDSLEGTSQYCNVSISQNELITPIATHVRGLYFTAVLVPPNTTDQMITPLPSPITTYAVFAAETDPAEHQSVATGADEQQITCTLPLNQADICSATLSNFVVSFADQYRTSPQALTRILEHVHRLVKS